MIRMNVVIVHGIGSHRPHPETSERNCTDDVIVAALGSFGADEQVHTVVAVVVVLRHRRVLRPGHRAESTEARVLEFEPGRQHIGDHDVIDRASIRGTDGDLHDDEIILLKDEIRELIPVPVEEGSADTQRSVLSSSLNCPSARRPSTAQ